MDSQDNAPPEGISGIRARIDAIDDRIAALFLERMDIVTDVAESKRRTGKRVFDPERERAIVSRLTKGVDRARARAIKLLFNTIFGIAKARQRTILYGEGETARAIREAMSRSGDFPQRATVACAGAEGSYAQQAACLMIEIPEIKYYGNFEKVFEAVESGECPYGVLPVENSAAGSVLQVYDLMQKHRFHIVRALKLKVEHVLLAARGTKLEDIREISSHPHALAQCSAFFRRHPGVKAVPAINTAAAAKELSVSPGPGRAVIASRACAELYGLEVVASGIQDVAYNYTRFICISKDLEVHPGADKFSIMLSLPHRPGALSDIIGKFAATGVNVTKLESRPIPGMDFEFRFIFDFDAPAGDAAVLGLIDELASDPEIAQFTFLGAYC